MEKGTRVTITKGKDGVGKSGLVFWSGPSKYGAGTRLGVKTDDGESAWCAATDVVREAPLGRDAYRDDSASLDGASLDGASLDAVDASLNGAPSNEGESQGFEFFCRHPNDWFEGANMGHLISFAFESDVDDETERVIADHLYGGGMSFENVLFSGRVMKFTTGGYGRSFLPKVEAFAQRLHAAVPIVDVVFHGIREGETGYAHSPVASADMGLQFGCPRPVDLNSPPWRKGEAFSARLEATHRVSKDDARVRQAREQIDKALAKQKDGPVHVHQATRPVLPPPELHFALALPSPRGGPPSAGDYPIAHPIAHEVRSLARVHDGTSYLSSALAVIEGGKRSVFEVGMPIQHLSMTPDGEEAMIASCGFLGRVNLSSGEVTPLPSPNVHETVRSIAALAEGSWAVLTGAALYLFDKSNALIHLKKLKANTLATFAEGYGIGVWKRDQFTAFRFVHGKLKQLCKFDYAPAPMQEIGDTLYFGTSVGDLALVGAHAEIAKERTRSPPRAKAITKAKAKALECELLSWVHAPDVHPAELDPVDLPPSIVVPSIVVPSIVAERASSSPSGEWVAFQNKDGLFVFHKPTGKVSPALPRCSDFFMNDKGRLVALGFGQVLWRHAPAREAREWPGKSYSLERREGRASYLHDHDLLVFFPDDGSPPTPFACGECIHPLMPLHGLSDAFEREGKAYFRWSGQAIQVEGLKEAAARFET